MSISNWFSLVRIIVIGSTAFAALVFLLRLTGKRALSRLNALELAVAVALGLTLESIMLDERVTLAAGALAFALLAGLQLAVTWGARRSKTVAGWVSPEPTLIFHSGRFVDGAMRRQRVTEDEVRAAMRRARVASIDDLQAVVLEPSGELSFIVRSAAARAAAAPLRIDLLGASAVDPFAAN